MEPAFVRVVAALVVAVDEHVWHGGLACDGTLRLLPDGAAEWHVNAADQSYQFYYDSKEVITFTRGAGVYKDAELPMTFSEVRLGWNNYQAAPPGFTAWLDDFALDDQRVACLP